MRQEDEKYKILQDETDELENTYYHMFLINNEEKKIKLLEEINKLREEETELQQELFIRETMLVPSLKLSQRESSLYNPEVINIPSPGRENRPWWLSFIIWIFIGVEKMNGGFHGGSKSRTNLKSPMAHGSGDEPKTYKKKY